MTAGPNTLALYIVLQTEFQLTHELAHLVYQDPLVRPAVTSLSLCASLRLVERILPSGGVQAVFTVSVFSSILCCECSLPEAAGHVCRQRVSSLVVDLTFDPPSQTMPCFCLLIRGSLCFSVCLSLPQQRWGNSGQQEAWRL